MAESKTTTAPVADEFVLGLCAEVREVRARAVLSWAKADTLDLFGNRPDSDEINQMNRVGRANAAEAVERFRVLTTAKPKSLQGAAEMLRIAAEVLHARQFDPEHILSEGDVVALIKQVVEQMGFNFDVAIGPGAMTGEHHV